MDIRTADELGAPPTAVADAVTAAGEDFEARILQLTNASLRPPMKPDPTGLSAGSRSPGEDTQGRSGFKADLTRSFCCMSIRDTVKGDGVAAVGSSGTGLVNGVVGSSAISDLTSDSSCTSEVDRQQLRPQHAAAPHSQLVFGTTIAGGLVSEGEAVIDLETMSCWFFSIL